MSCEFISCIHTAVLSARTTKADHQAFKSSFDIFLHRYINDVKYTVQPFRHLGLSLQEIFYLFIPAGLRFHTLDPSRVQNTAAIKNKYSAVIAIVLRNDPAV